MKTIGELEKEVWERIDRQQIRFYSKEAIQCPSCQVYTDDPEHSCGSLSLVPWLDIPAFWAYCSIPEEFIVKWLEKEKLI